MRADGTIEAKLDEGEVSRKFEAPSDGIRSLAIVFMHA